MAAPRRVMELMIGEKDLAELGRIARSRTLPARRVERARILLAYHNEPSSYAVGVEIGVAHQTVQRCLARAVKFGVKAALDDSPRPGKAPVITEEARAWVVSLACRKAKDLGYPHELWTTRLLARHIRAHSLAAGHPSLARIAQGTVCKILARHEVKPHKVRYYLERRDAAFDQKMAEVLCVYREVALLRAEAAGSTAAENLAILSYDEKPGIQAIANTAPDLTPQPSAVQPPPAEPPSAAVEPPADATRPRKGRARLKSERRQKSRTRCCVARDHEYKRLGTLSLLAGIDLLTGKVHARVEERHRSREFVSFLKDIDAAYPAGTAIKIILDNHSSHVSKETRRWLAAQPDGRFSLVFTPKHGSWLNLVERFFSKMARSMLRQIRVASKAELKQRIMAYLDDVNSDPVIHTWSYKLAQAA